MEQLQNPAVRTHEELRTEPNYINLEPALPGAGGAPTFQTIGSPYADPTHQLINSNYHIHPANYYTIEQMNSIAPQGQNHYGQPPDLQQQQQPQYPTDHAMMSELAASEDLKSDDEMNKEKLRKATHNGFFFATPPAHSMAHDVNERPAGFVGSFGGFLSNINVG